MPKQGQKAPYKPIFGYLTEDEPFSWFVPGLFLCLPLKTHRAKYGAIVLTMGVIVQSMGLS